MDLSWRKFMEKRDLTPNFTQDKQNGSRSNGRSDRRGGNRKRNNNR